MAGLQDSITRLSRAQLLERPVRVSSSGANPSEDVTWKCATITDIDSLSEKAIQYNEGRKRFARQMLEEGSICIIGYIDGEAAHVGWMSFDRIFSPPFDLPLGPGWVCFHRTRTAPRFRGRGLQGAGINKRLEIANERGLTRAVNMVDLGNPVSLRNYHRAGFVDREKIWALEIFGRKVVEGIPRTLKTRLASDASAAG